MINPVELFPGTILPFKNSVWFGPWRHDPTRIGFCLFLAAPLSICLWRPCGIKTVNLTGVYVLLLDISIVLSTTDCRNLHQTECSFADEQMWCCVPVYGNARDLLQPLGTCCYKFKSANIPFSNKLCLIFHHYHNKTLLMVILIYLLVFNHCV